MRNLKRILALALTVLMVVGAVPMAVFAAESEPVDSIENYTGEPWDSKYDPTANITGTYNPNANYWKNVSYYLTDNRGGVTNVGGVITSPAQGADSQPRVTITNPHSASAKASFWDKDFAGFDVAINFDYMPLSTSTTEKPGRISIWTYTADTSSNQYTVLTALAVADEDGKITHFDLSWSGTGGTVAGKKICEIPADQYTNIRMLLDATEDSWIVYVYVNNKYVGCRDVISNLSSSQYTTLATQKNLIASWRSAEPDKEVTDGFIFNGMLFHSQKCTAFKVANLGYYFYNSNGEGSLTDSDRTINVNNPVITYNNFDNLTVGENVHGKALSCESAGLSASVQSKGESGQTTVVVDDGKGGAAIQSTSEYIGFAAYGTLNDVKNKGLLGKNFILSIDFKLHPTATIQAGKMLGATANDLYKPEGAQYMYDINAGFVFVDANGNLYSAVPGATAASTNLIGKLSKNEFTNIAAFVNPEENYFIVYINGIAVTDKIILLDETAQNHLVAAGYKATDFAFNYYRTVRNVVVDNFAFAYADTNILANTNPLNGVKKEGNDYIYYKNGQRVENSFVEGTNYYAGAKGVLVEDSYVDVGGKLYDITDYIAVAVNGIKNNNLYIDGVLLKNGAGVYNGNTYLADADGKLLSGIYTVNGEEWFFDHTTYIGTKFVFEEGNGTIVDTNNGNQYDTIQDAINGSAENGELKIYDDVDTDDAILIDKGISINLNGNTIKAPQITINAGSEVVVSKDNKGYFDVPKGKLHISGEISNAISYYVENKGYTFATVKDQSAIPEADKNNNGFVFIFRPTLDESTALNKAVFGAGSVSDVKLVVKLVDEDDNVIRSFRYSYDLVANAYNGEGQALKLTVKNVDGKYGNIKVVYGIEAGTGMICEMVAGDFTATNGKISILGDSISTYKGVAVGGRDYYGPGGENSTNDLTDVSQTWWAQLIADKGYTLEVNQSRSGSPVCNTGYQGNSAKGVSFIDRMTNIGNPDVIAIHGGTNDWGAKSPIGEYKYADWTEDDLKSFRPAYAYMLDYLTTNHPDAQIVVIVPETISADYSESIKTICDYYGVTYVQLVEVDKSTDTSSNPLHPGQQGMTDIFNQVKDYFN